MGLINIRYKIKFFSYWHCSSGLASGSNADALVIKDADGLPYVPGKTIKGLLRQAYEELYGDNMTLFGDESNPIPGTSFYSDATLLESRSGIIRENLQSELYSYIASTAIDEDGIAKEHSLRNMQVTIPCALEGKIISVPEEAFDNLNTAARLIKELGLHRSRGLGRCQFELEPEQSQDTLPEMQDSTRRTLQFRCHLESDIILNRESGSKTQNKTLDFIPGSNFLGIVARAYDSFSEEEAMTIFHSGKVRFSDAHPAVGDNRSLRVPASLYYPKLESPSSKTYQHHLLATDAVVDLTGIQLKQCRSGFFDLQGIQTLPASQARVERHYSVKSAYDREKRRSKDESLFLYESIDGGMDFFFYVDMDSDVSDDVVKKVFSALIGEHRIGRSRSAQYGLVFIEPATFAQPVSVEKEQKRHVVYAEGRLIFFDQFGMPTFQPSASDLGFNADAQINWSLSQIRTFSYAPWNGKREGFDTDRCGIEKGSVFIVDCPYEVKTPQTAFVGCYKNEGFGRVLYNPDFLESAFLLAATADPDTGSENRPDEAESELLKVLKARKEENSFANSIYRVVNTWKASYGNQFLNGDFASQWGTIRSIAVSSHNQGKNTLIDRIRNYVTTGVASARWEGKSDLLLEKFVTSLHDNGVPDNMVWKAIVNLSAVMSKGRQENN